MDLTQLELFKAIAEEGSISAARYRNIWLLWRHGARSANLSAFIDLIQPYRITQSS